VKLVPETNEKEKTVKVKIGRTHSTRQVISLVMDNLKNDWKVVISAFSHDIGKVLRVTEIVKQRFPFLHQQNQLLFENHMVVEQLGEGDQGKVEEREVQRSGLQVTLSRTSIDSTDEVGYQKPKPRQFVRLRPSSRPQGNEAVKDLKKV
jgi:DNA-binding protein